MPIYEFYCEGCNTIFNFFSKTVNTTKQPTCPSCGRKKLNRQVSLFAMTRKGAGGEGGGDEMGDLPIDESKMESAMNALASEAENINEDDPRQAAQLMRKFSKMTGMEFGEGMEQALGRLEAGEDPEAIEEEMGGMLDGEEDPFILPGGKKGAGGRGRSGRGHAPRRDPTLYDM